MARTTALILAILAIVAGVVVARELASEWWLGVGGEGAGRREGRWAASASARALTPPADPRAKKSPPQQPTPPPSTGTADCITLAQQVGRGECAPFLNDVRGDINGLTSQGDDSFKSALQPYINRHGSGGKLTGGCCNEAASFIAEGCSCNRLILTAATRMGFGATVVSSIPRLYQFSCVGGSSSFANGCSFSGSGVGR